MNRPNCTRQSALSLVLLMLLCTCGVTWAQSALPTAVQDLQLSAFGGLTGDLTGLAGGKNLGLTAGADLGLLPVYHLRPTLEFRGTYPVDKGTIDAQRTILGGLRAGFLLNHKVKPYGDFLFGRGQMNYGGGYIYGNYDYELTTTWVYGPGAGFDYPISDHLQIKVDGQFQHWSDTPTPSGTIWSKSGTVGVVYIFNFNRHGIH